MCSSQIYSWGRQAGVRVPSSVPDSWCICAVLGWDSVTTTIPAPGPWALEAAAGVQGTPAHAGSYASSLWPQLQLPVRKPCPGMHFSTCSRLPFSIICLPAVLPGCGQTVTKEGERYREERLQHSASKNSS